MLPFSLDFQGKYKEIHVPQIRFCVHLSSDYENEKGERNGKEETVF